jgi:hypothetical protein
MAQVLRTRPRSRLLPLACILLALGVVAVGVLWWQRSAARREAIDQLLGEVATATAGTEPDGSALSALVARIQQQPEHGDDRSLQVAMARIEFARGRLDRAMELLRPWAAGVEPTADELLLAARVQLARFAVGSVGSELPDSVLRQAQDFAESAHAQGQGEAALLLAWLAAYRRGDSAEIARLGQALAAHPDSPEAEFVRAASEFNVDGQLEPLDALRRRMPAPPLELDLMRVQIMLRVGALTEAMGEVERLLQAGAAMHLVRHVAAVAWHGQAMAQEGAPREQSLRQRDAHLAWLQSHMPLDDSRRELWQQLLQTR